MFLRFYQVAYIFYPDPYMIEFDQDITKTNIHNMFEEDLGQKLEAYQAFAEISHSALFIPPMILLDRVEQVCDNIGSKLRPLECKKY